MISEDRRPEVTVILPCRDGLPLLAEQLDALVAQEDPGAWELVVVDNGSTDGSAELALRYADRLPVRVVAAPSPANVSHARNVGVAEARAERVAFIDADDRVAPGWVGAMRRALAAHPFVGGVPVPDGSGASTEAAEASAAWSRAPAEGFLPYAQGNTLGVHRRCLEAVGGFDLELGALMVEDAALSWRLQIAGVPLHREPAAVVRYRARQDTRSAWRQQHRLGIGQVRLYTEFRSCGMARSGDLRAAGRWLALVVALPLVPFSARLRGRWTGTLARRSGRVVGSFRYRVRYL